jgi:hypothetical protein
VSLTSIRPIRLSAEKPTLRLTAHVSKPTTLDLRLADAKGRTLAHWRTRAKKGVNILALLLPAKARHPGRDKLRVSSAGSTKPETFAVTVTN